MTAVLASIALGLALLPTLLYAFQSGSGTCIADRAQIASAAGGAMGPPTRYSYTLSSSTPTYTPGNTLPINITLSGPDKYIGLLLYAATSLMAHTHLGKWTSIDKTQFQFMNAECEAYGENATLTHSDPFPKHVKATFQWVPPETAPDGDVRFYAAVVAKPHELVGFEIVESEPITVQGGTETAAAIGEGVTATITAEDAGPTSTLESGDEETIAAEGGAQSATRKFRRERKTRRARKAIRKT